MVLSIPLFYLAHHRSIKSSVQRSCNDKKKNNCHSTWIHNPETTAAIDDFLTEIADINPTTLTWPNLQETENMGVLHSEMKYSVTRLMHILRFHYKSVALILWCGLL